MKKDFIYNLQASDWLKCCAIELGRERKIILTGNIINGHSIMGHKLNTTNRFTEIKGKRFRNKCEHYFTFLTFLVAKLKNRSSQVKISKLSLLHNVIWHQPCYPLLFRLYKLRTRLLARFLLNFPWGQSHKADFAMNLH